MRNPGGYAVWSGPDRKQVERDTFTCKHCNSVVFVQPKMSPTELGGYCALCAAPICSGCAGKTCVPFERRLEEQERRFHQRRQLEKALGL